MTEQELSEWDTEIIEADRNDFYYRVLLVDDRIMGFQSIGRLIGSGAMFSLIKKRTGRKEIREVLANPQLRDGLTGYLQAGQYLLSND